MLIIQKIIQKNEVLIDKKYDINPIYQLFKDIKKNYTNYINNNKFKFSDESCIKTETISEFKNIIDLLMSEKYNIACAKKLEGQLNSGSEKDSSKIISIIQKGNNSKCLYFRHYPS